jgi:hypothetical protein
LSQSARAALAKFLGSPSAVALSAAMLMFFKAASFITAHGPTDIRPVASPNRWGDRVSGIGAILPGLGLLNTGEPLL